MPKMIDCGSTPLIYLAEDDRELRSLLAAALLHAGYDVLELCSGHKLLEALTSAFLRGETAAQPRAVISDVRMPGLDGLEVVNVLRQYDPHTPVVVISAFADDEVRARAQELGVSSVLSKPFPPVELVSALNAALLSAA